MKELGLNLDNAFLHDIQLVDTQMTSLHCDVKMAKMEEKNIKTNISIHTQGNAVDNRVGESSIEVIIQSDAFDLRIVQMGKFEKNEAMDISTDVFEDFLASQGIRLLWSFARENVYEITCKMLRKPIMLPTLDVMKTLKADNRSVREETNGDKTRKIR